MEIIEWIPAKNLITSDRFDLIAKYIYVKYKIENYSMLWAVELYSAHIEAFSGGSYQEPGQPQKNSLKAYIDIYDYLIESIKNSGFDKTISVIPVSFENKIIQDGAHRVAIGAYLNKIIPCYLVRQEKIYDASFFRKQLLDEKYLDFMLTQYVEYKRKDMLTIIIWPHINKDKKMIEDTTHYISRNMKLVHDKVITSSTKRIGNILRELRMFIGQIDEHADLCINKFYHKIKVYIVEYPKTNYENVFRDLSLICKQNMYISRDYYETLTLVHMFFNLNSLNLAKKGEFLYDFNLYEQLVNFQSLLIKNEFNMEEFLIVSPIIFGINEMNEESKLRYITLSNKDTSVLDNCAVNITKILDIDNFFCSEIILNPRNYFYFLNIKVITCSALKKYKKVLPYDICWLNKIRANINSLTFIKNKIIDIFKSAKRLLRNYKTRLRMILYKRNLCFLVKFWHFMKEKRLK